MPVLNNADKVYAGSSEVDVIYAGEVEVWRNMPPASDARLSIEGGDTFAWDRGPWRYHYIGPGQDQNFRNVTVTLRAGANDAFVNFEAMFVAGGGGGGTDAQGAGAGGGAGGIKWHSGTITGNGTVQIPNGGNGATSGTGQWGSPGGDCKWFTVPPGVDTDPAVWTAKGGGGGGGIGGQTSPNADGGSGGGSCGTSNPRPGGNPAVGTGIEGQGNDGGEGYLPAAVAGAGGGGGGFSEVGGDATETLLPWGAAGYAEDWMIFAGGGPGASTILDPPGSLWWAASGTSDQMPGGNKNPFGVGTANVNGSGGGGAGQGGQGLGRGAQGFAMIRYPNALLEPLKFTQLSDGLHFVLDGDEIIRDQAPPADGAAIPRWETNSPSFNASYAVVQSTANYQPRYRVNVPELDGHNGVEFFTNTTTNPGYGQRLQAQIAIAQYDIGFFCTFVPKLNWDGEAGDIDPYYWIFYDGTVGVGISNPAVDPDNTYGVPMLFFKHGSSNNFFYCQEVFEDVALHIVMGVSQYYQFYNATGIVVNGVSYNFGGAGGTGGLSLGNTSSVPRNFNPKGIFGAVGQNSGAWCRNNRLNVCHHLMEHFNHGYPYAPIKATDNYGTWTFEARIDDTIAPTSRYEPLSYTYEWSSVPAGVTGTTRTVTAPLYLNPDDYEVSCKVTVTDGPLEFSNTEKVNITAGPFPYSVNSFTGGEVTQVGGFRYHKFLANDTLTFVNTDGLGTPVLADLFLVGGGGGSNGSKGGGGGGGGVLLVERIELLGQNHTIEIGQGGGNVLNPATNSTISQTSPPTILATGLAGGGGGSSGIPGADGGSGGGGGGNSTTAGGKGTPGQGFDGGPGADDSSRDPSGGGGGAGGPGQGVAVPLTNPREPVAHGGPGREWPEGSGEFYGGGGGGGVVEFNDAYPVRALGGVGGGGDGEWWQDGLTRLTGEPGENGRGGGAGGGALQSGGSGVVIVRYPFNGGA